MYIFVCLCCCANRVTVMTCGGYKDVFALNPAFKSFFKCFYFLLLCPEEVVNRRQTSADLHRCTMVMVGVEVVVVEFCKVPFFVYCRKVRDFFGRYKTTLYNLESTFICKATYLHLYTSFSPQSCPRFMCGCEMKDILDMATLMKINTNTKYWCLPDWFFFLLKLVRISNVKWMLVTM